jgi:hypothetical protein
MAPRGLILGSLLLLASACGGTAGGASTTASALSTALASGTDAAGTLLCAPSTDQVTACTGEVAGDACTLTAPDGTTTIDGTCRATIDGTVVACAPNPPAPPAELVAACSGLTLGNACTVTEAFGNTRTGTCVTARDGSTLVCGRVHVPPQAAIDACATAAAGAACTMPGPMGTGTVAGTCSMGPAGSGPLACTPQRDLLPHGAEACANLAVGAACTLGRMHETLGGTCVAPADGSAAVCVVACADVGGRFACGPGGHHGPGGMH